MSDLSVIVRFQREDFELDSSYPIAIKNKNCGMILFHVNNDESLGLGTTLLNFANDKIVPIDRLNKFIGTCNFEIETEVAQAFLKIARNDKKMGKFAINRLPCFIVYQNGMPVTFWEGSDYVNKAFTPETIGNYFTFEVCNPNLEYKGQTSRKGLNYYRETSSNSKPVFGEPYTLEERENLEYETGIKKSMSRRRNCNGDDCYIIKPTVIQMVDPRVFSRMYITNDE